MIKVHASGYIWTNLEFEYPLNGVSFKPHMHNVNHLVKKYFKNMQWNSVRETSEWRDSFIWCNNLNRVLKCNLCSC